MFTQQDFLKIEFLYVCCKERQSTHKTIRGSKKARQLIFEAGLFLRVHPTLRNVFVSIKAAVLLCTFYPR